MSDIYMKAFPGNPWDPTVSQLAIEESLRTTPPPSEFILPGFKRGTVGALVSPGGVGKSFWALALGAAMSNPKYIPKFGLEATQGGMILLSAEEDTCVLGERLRAQRDALDPFGEDSSLWRQAQIHSLFGIPFDLFEPQCFDPLVSLGQSTQAKLIVLDTLSRFHRLDENSSRDMALVISRLEELALLTGASVLYIHHSSKAAGRAMQTDLPQAARGSSVLVDNARWVSFMEPMSPAQAKQFHIKESARSKYVRWNVSKQNYGPAREDLWYVRRPGGALVAASFNQSEEKDPAWMTPLDTPDVIIAKGTVRESPSALLSAKGARLDEW